MPNAFVAGNHAIDIYLLNKQGIPIAENQQEITPFQRQVLVQEEIRRNEQEQEMMEEAENSPQNSISPGARNSRSSHAQAIKESHEEEERYINKSMVDND